ncbi:MAG: DUF3127 domain-containing protein [Sphingobacteriales bacterium]|nr:MAG: DUF3127 domain-containing protein [Sphingobacteriales bacterium]TAF81344.1 MAG: DUF3127 domain-containing protein [Sphingobacteriales bacterium]
MEIKGKIHEVSDIINVTESFRKRELVIEYAENPQYPEFVKFEAIQDKCVLLDNLQLGAEVEVSFNLKGRPYTDKAGKKSYFNSLHVWRITSLNTAMPPVAAAPAPEYAPPVDVSAAPGEDDDLPF